MNAYAAAATDGREAELHGELEALVDEHNTAETAKGHASKPPTCV